MSIGPSNYLQFVLVNGERLGMVAHWLRWWDEAGNLLLWSSEIAEQERQRTEQECQRAEQESQRAEQLAAKLRELYQVVESAHNLVNCIIFS